jgi:hypothetical protein
MTEETGAPEIAPWGTPYPLGFLPINEDREWPEDQAQSPSGQDQPWNLVGADHAEDSVDTDRPDDYSGAPRAQIVYIDIVQQRSDLFDVLDGVIACLTVVNDALESVLTNRKDRKQLSLFHSILEALGLG